MEAIVVSVDGSGVDGGGVSLGLGLVGYEVKRNQIIEEIEKGCGMCMVYTLCEWRNHPREQEDN